MQEEFLNIQEDFCIFSNVFARKRKFFPLFRRTRLTNSVKNGFGAIHKKAVMSKNMLPRLTEMITVYVDQPSASDTLQMEMLTTVLCILHVLVASAAGLVDDVFSHLSAL